MANTITATQMNLPAKTVHAGAVTQIIRTPLISLSVSSTDDRVFLTRVPRGAVLFDFALDINQPNAGATAVFPNYVLGLRESSLTIDCLSTSGTNALWVPDADTNLPIKASWTTSVEGSMMDEDILYLRIGGQGASTTASVSIQGWVEWVLDDHVL